MGAEVVFDINNGIVIGAGGGWRQRSFVKSGLTRGELLTIYRGPSHPDEYLGEYLGIVDPLHIFLRVALSCGRVKVDNQKLKKLKVKKDVRRAIRSFQRNVRKGKW